MQILWWLAPPAVATVLAMVWVAWLGRAGRGRIDREVAVRRQTVVGEVGHHPLPGGGAHLPTPLEPLPRLSEALARPTKPSRTTPSRPAVQAERSSGVAVRPSSRPADNSHERTRRAS